MLSRRTFLSAVGLAMSACLPSAAAALQKPAKPKLTTVTLVVDGMI